MFENLVKILKSKTGLFGIIFGIVIITIPSYYFLDYKMVIGNKGYLYLFFEIFLNTLIAILFGVFLGATLYKMSYFNIKKTGTGFFGGFLGVLVSGCPSCTITFASYLGLSGLISILPYDGFELKIISVFLLLYVCYTMLKNLEICELKLKNKIGKK